MAFPHGLTRQMVVVSPHSSPAGTRTRMHKNAQECTIISKDSDLLTTASGIAEYQGSANGYCTKSRPMSSDPIFPVLLSHLN